LIRVRYLFSCDAGRWDGCESGWRANKGKTEGCDRGRERRRDRREEGEVVDVEGVGSVVDMASDTVLRGG
jgi:hypothetical protein